MRIVFMGSPDFAVESLKALYEAGHEIVLVVSKSDTPKGRSGEKTPTDVKAWALDHNLPVFTPEKIRAAESVEFLKKYPCDVAVVVAFGQILSEEVLNLPRLGCVNVHASLLPKYRGAAPIQWSILNGDEYTGVTTMQMGVGLDDGDILLQREYKIGEEETGGELFDNLSKVGGELIVETLSKLEKGEITPVAQDEALATKVGKISKQQGKIDFMQQAQVIERQIRGLNPWPSAYCSFEGKTLKIWKAKVYQPDESENKLSDKLSELKTGELSGKLVKCGQDSYLELVEVQLEGKKRMPVDDFLRGIRDIENKRICLE